MTDQNQPKGDKPVYSLRSGRIRGSIWRNITEEGEPWYNTTYERTYKDEKESTEEKPVYKNSTSFSSVDHLRIAYLAPIMYQKEEEFRQYDAYQKRSAPPASPARN